MDGVAPGEKRIPFVFATKRFLVPFHFAFVLSMVTQVINLRFNNLFNLIIFKFFILVYIINK